MKYYIYDKEVADPNAQQLINKNNGNYQGCPNFFIRLYNGLLFFTNDLFSKYVLTSKR